MENNEQFKLKDLEILVWFMIPVWAFYHVSTKYGMDYLRENPTMGIIFFYALFPAMFAFILKFIYDEFPIGFVIKSILKK